MKTKLLLIICGVLLSIGCVKAPVTVSAPLADPCPIPAGFQMGPAIEVAKATLNRCPGKLDQVFIALIDVGKHNPGKENGTLIQNMLKGLIKKNKISKTYAKGLYQKYFSINFVTIPDMKAYNLAGEVIPIKRALGEELACKRIGMVECCNDKASYKKAENQFARATGFIENLAYNEEYLKTLR